MHEQGFVNAKVIFFLLQGSEVKKLTPEKPKFTLWAIPAHRSVLFTS
jgi:hypothetical protein